MIDITHLSKTFNRGSSNEVKALTAINLSINAKEFVVIVGANGSGKSTLLNAIAGSVSVEEGEIKIEGAEVTHKKEYERSPWIAHIFQNPLAGTAPDLSILDNLRLASLRSQPKKLHIGINEKFRKQAQEKISILGMGLENKLDQAMGTLSGGQRQALTLVMSIMDTSKILLLDEPTAALDPKSSQVLMENADKIISEYNLTALLITHSLKDAHTYGSRILQMEEGKIIRDLNMDEKQQLSLTDLFQWFV